MSKLIFANTVVAVCASLAIATSAHAEDKSAQTFSLNTQSQDFNQGFGTLTTASFEYKYKAKTSTFVLTPIVGQRDTAATKETSIGAGLAVYHNWSSIISTRSEVFVAEDKSPFQHLDVAQDVTGKIGTDTAITLGARWARYAGGQDVWFVSGGVRQYFKGGSVAYRLSWTKPDTRNGYLSHLGSLTINDSKGKGKTQLWLSVGSASLATSQLPDSFRGKDLAGFLQRFQPINERMALLLSLGLSSYDRPVSRVTAKTFGLGLSIELN